MPAELENSGGLTAYGSFIALGLVVVLAALLIPLSRGRLNTRAFVAASSVLALLVVFFWLWPTITEISIWKFGSIKTNVEQARVYLSQLKAIESQVGDIKARIEADATRAQELQNQAAKMRADLEKEIAARQPRLINPEQRVQLVAALTKINLKGKLTVTWKLFDEEAERFGKQILESLNEAGFDAKEIRGSFGFGIPGQWILLRDLEKYQHEPSWIGDVQAALNSTAGVSFDGRQMDSTWKPEFGEVAIVVGAKP
jgi:hypothetical protein